MRRVTALVVLVIALAACSTPKTGHPQLGSPTSGATSTATPSAGPSFHLPPDVKVVVDYTKTGDPTKDKMLADLAVAQTALIQAKYDANPDDPQLLQYTIGDGKDGYRLQVADFKTPHSFIGTFRDYNLSVVSVAGDFSEVDGCEDVSQMFDRDPKTNKAIPHDPGYHSFAKIKKSLRLDGGVWKVNDFSGEDVSSC